LRPPAPRPWPRCWSRRAEPTLPASWPRRPGCSRSNRNRSPEVAILGSPPRRPQAGTFHMEEVLGFFTDAVLPGTFHSRLDPCNGSPLVVIDRHLREGS
jgi:hypothetical protein